MLLFASFLFINFYSLISLKITILTLLIRWVHLRMLALTVGWRLAYLRKLGVLLFVFGFRYTHHFNWRVGSKRGLFLIFQLELLIYSFALLIWNLGTSIIDAISPLISGIRVFDWASLSTYLPSIIHPITYSIYLIFLPKVSLFVCYQLVIELSSASLWAGHALKADLGKKGQYASLEAKDIGHKVERASYKNDY